MDWRARGVIVAAVVLLASLHLAGSAAAAAPEAPDEDVVGWEGGYWHNESIGVDQSDGLSEDELEAYVSRAMARIEVIRGEEFESDVPVEVVDRDEYRNRTTGNASEEYRAWNNQVWEALFIVGEDEDADDVLHSTSTAATTGGYFFEEGEIRIITDTPDDTAIDRSTLSHELVHALQDQQFDLSNETYDSDTQDQQLAVNGLIEGEANYVEAKYEERCGEEWACVSDPPSDADVGGDSGGDADEDGPDDPTNLGVLFTLYHPYSDGPPYVHSIYEEGGWDAVDEAYEVPPNSTEQIIHHTDEEPVPLEVDDEARNGWETYPDQGVDGADTAGEASMFTMMWYQSVENGALTIDDEEGIDQTDGPYDTYNYDADPTAGWGNDAILPYHKETSSGTEHGYVWTTEWDTEDDAREFHQAYLALLWGQDADVRQTRTWVIDEGPFADAFRVERDGTRVTIVNAPEIEDLDDIRPSTPNGVDGNPTSPPPNGIDETPPENSEGTDNGPMETPGQSGFGVATALSGIFGWLLLRRRSRA